MANSEDYLDSLLKAASQQNDNPDSAINKVRDLNRAEALEASEPENEEPLADEPLIDMPDIDESTVEEPAIVDLVPEDIAIEESIVEEPVIEESVTEEPVIEEPIIEDSEIEETELEDFTLDDTLTEESVLEDMVSEETAPEENLLDDTENIEDIDSLLKSDFAGEIDMSSIDSLFDEADSFANSEETVEDNQEVDVEESQDLSFDMNEESLSEEDIQDSSEDILSLSEDEITNMIDSASSVEENTVEEPIEIDLNDLDSLESLGIKEKSEDDADSQIDDLADLGDLSDLLNAAESNEVIDTSEDNLIDRDMLDLLSEAVEESTARDEEIARAKEEKANKEKEEKESKKKKRKEKKEKKKKADSESEEIDIINEGEKKKSFIARIIDFLTAEEEEENDLLNPQDAGEGGAAGFEGMQGENKEILDEIDKEGEGGKKKKKKKKGKKGKGEDAPQGDGEEGAEEEVPKKKEKKPKKEKKEKKPLELDVDTGKPLSKRNVSLIFVLAATILVAVILVSKLVPAMLSSANARRAYYDGDYETVYLSFYGEKLSDSDQILFDRAKVVLKVNHKYDAFATYMNMDKKTEALDQLLQAVEKYEIWLFEAETVGAANEFKTAYSKITGALSSTFNLSESDAWELLRIPENLEYTLRLYSIATGTEYIDINNLPGEFIPPVNIENTENIDLEETESEIEAEGDLDDVLSEEGN